MKLTWFGHSCFSIDVGSSRLIVDPFLKGNPTFEKSGVPWDTAVAGVTHVALTHGHGDHIGDAGEICARSGATLMATYELAIYVKGKGAEKIEPMNTGGTIYTADFDLTLVNALHSSSTDVYLGNPNGIVVRPKAGGPVLYHMGDTDMHAEMALIAEFHKPEVVIVPIGDRFTMGARAAAFAMGKFFPNAKAIPAHYGTFPGMLDPDASKFVAEMKGRSVIVAKVGESFSV